MNKQQVLKAVIAKLQANLERQKAANRGASEGAIDSESRAETKWDTSGLEASYLARGYARQFEETARQLEILRNFEVQDAPGTRVALGSLVQTQTEGYFDWLFLLPCCGGMEVRVQDAEVTVVTPESPLASQLLQKVSGSTYRTPNGLECRIVTVV